MTATTKVPMIPFFERGTNFISPLSYPQACASIGHLPLSARNSNVASACPSFVAVGRRMSITLAARDLCLTQSAVSRQVNALEAQLGLKLLLRGYRSIAFTPEGERLFRSADGAVQQLQDVLGEIRTTGLLRPVVLSASIGFTGLWLLPRPSKFQKLHPGVDLRVSANNRLSDLRHDGIDLAVRYCAPAPTLEVVTRLFGESLAPVAHQ